MHTKVDYVNTTDKHKQPKQKVWIFSNPSVASGSKDSLAKLFSKMNYEVEETDLHSLTPYSKFKIGKASDYQFNQGDLLVLPGGHAIGIQYHYDNDTCHALKDKINAIAANGHCLGICAGGILMGNKLTFLSEPRTEQHSRSSFACDNSFHPTGLMAFESFAPYSFKQKKPHSTFIAESQKIEFNPSLHTLDSTSGNRFSVFTASSPAFVRYHTGHEHTTPSIVAQYTSRMEKNFLKINADGSIKETKASALVKPAALLSSQSANGFFRMATAYHPEAKVETLRTYRDSDEITATEFFSLQSDLPRHDAFFKEQLHHTVLTPSPYAHK